MKLYGLKTCDTCRKAMKSLNDVTFLDVRKDGVPSEILERAIVQFGDALLNKKSKTWRELDDVTRELAPLDLLNEAPTVMKRPLIENDGVLYLGWTADVRTALGVA